MLRIKRRSRISLILSTAWMTNKDGSRTGNQIYQQARSLRWLLSSESLQMARLNRSRSRQTTLLAESYLNCSMSADEDPEEPAPRPGKLAELAQGEYRPSLLLVGPSERLEKISCNSWFDPATTRRVCEERLLQSLGFKLKDSKRFFKERSRLKESR